MVGFSLAFSVLAIGPSYRLRIESKSLARLAPGGAQIAGTVLLRSIVEFEDICHNACEAVIEYSRVYVTYLERICFPRYYYILSN